MTPDPNLLDELQGALERLYVFTNGHPHEQDGRTIDEASLEALAKGLNLWPSPTVALGDAAEIFGARAPRGGIPGRSFARALFKAGAHCGLWTVFTFDEIFEDELVRAALRPHIGREFEEVTTLPNDVPKLFTDLKTVEKQMRKALNAELGRGKGLQEIVQDTLDQVKSQS